jgi:hypothetical protein
MRVVPERSPLAQIAVVFGGFFVGPWTGLRLAIALTPESDLVQTASVFGFALVFAGGMLLWAGFGIVTVVFGALVSLVRGRRPGLDSPRITDRTVLPGYRAFPVMGLVFGLLLGLLAALATELTLLTATAAWTFAGLGYGLALWAAAHHGYLPFPEP